MELDSYSLKQFQELCDEALDLPVKDFKSSGIRQRILIFLDQVEESATTASERKPYTDAFVITAKKLIEKTKDESFLRGVNKAVHELTLSRTDAAAVLDGLISNTEDEVMLSGITAPKFRKRNEDKLRVLKHQKEKFSKRLEIGDQPQLKIKDGLEEIIYPDYVFQFTQIEQELFNRGFLNADYKWIGTPIKKTACEFIVTVSALKYTKGKITPLTLRRAFERRYGFEQNGLAEMFKPIKRPKFESAKITFRFILAPDKR